MEFQGFKIYFDFIPIEIISNTPLIQQNYSLIQYCNKTTNSSLKMPDGKYIQSKNKMI